jgi:pimeloyl-ACP methyl ester carboxylesterase
MSMSKLHHERRRDDQSWIFDWIVQETGQVQNWDRPESRGLPREVRNYAMIPKHVGRQGLHREAVARAAEKAGHTQTAIAAYQQAIMSYHTAQHSIYTDDSEEKIRWYGRLAACFERIVALSKNPMERIEVPWEGNEIQVAYSPLPAGQQQAPCLIIVPGMDDVKERAVFTFSGLCRERGLHMLAMDGPGQGASNLRKIRITADNYERAVSSVIDYVTTRPEVDPDNILLLGMGTGSLWAIRAAAHDSRFRAVAAGPSTVFGDVTAAFEQVSPRYKRVYMYMAGIHDEDEFDEQVASRLTTFGVGKHITCPALLVQGEYDPMSPLEDGMQLFEDLAGPKEFWILEDGVHGGTISHIGLGNLKGAPFMVDWLAGVALRDAIGEDHRRVKWIPPKSGCGPYDCGEESEALC